MADFTGVFNGPSKMFKQGSSQGNQKKFIQDNKFYKLDQFGYEGLSEVIASRLAKQTSLSAFGVVEYEPYSNGKKHGCFSKIFTNEDVSEITLYRLLLNRYNTDLRGVYQIYEETYDTLIFSFFDFIRDTILDVYDFDVLSFFTQLLEFDWLIVNGDRHFRNISLLVSSDKLIAMPVFDNGAGFLSNLEDNPMNVSIEQCITNIEAKPFNTSFEAQVRQLKKYHASTLVIPNKVVIPIQDIVGVYPSEYIERVHGVLVAQMNKLFPGVEVMFDE